MQIQLPERSCNAVSGGEWRGRGHAPLQEGNTGRGARIPQSVSLEPRVEMKCTAAVKYEINDLRAMLEGFVKLETFFLLVTSSTLSSPPLPRNNYVG